MSFKKIISAVMCAGVLSSGIVLSMASAAVNLGDVNEDNKVDSKDAVLVLKDYAENLAGKRTTIDKTVADVNSDNSVDSKDAVWILRYYANTLTGYEKDISEFIKNPPAEPAPAQTEPTKANHNHYYGELIAEWDPCPGVYYYGITNGGDGDYLMIGDENACRYAIDHGFAPNKGDYANGFVYLG